MVSESRLPIFVDLDRSLVRTDLLHESFLPALARAPGRVVLSALGGRARLKQVVFGVAPPDAATLPYNEEVIAFLASAKKAGRPLILATASDESAARCVADHLDLFDEVIASDGTTNQKAGQKLQAIRRLCKARGWERFGYVGDSASDRAIWEAADQVYVCVPPGVDAARKSGRAPTEVFRTQPTRGAMVLKALRPHQWAKNLLVFVPVLAGHAWSEPGKLLSATLAFFCFSLAASAVYLVNDLVDLASDRRHPTKRRRPFASGALPVHWGPIVATVLLLSAVGVALTTLPLEFVAVLAGYLLLTSLYSFWLKRKLMVDVLALAGLYTTRIYAGGVATGIAISQWLLSFSMFLFLSLAFAKRYTELHRIPEDASSWISGRGYRRTDFQMIETIGPASGLLAVLVLAMYVSSQDVMEHYAKPQLLWLLCPLLLYWVARVWFLARRDELDEDPVVFALTDKVSRLVVLIGVAIVLLATYV